MVLIQIIVLALIQGLTEFLPVSSSAHLILGSRVMGWPDQGLAFDVATHLGTLLAVLIYFRHELASMIGAWFGSLDSDKALHRRLGLYLAFASIPALLIGYMAADWVEQYLRDPRIIAVTTIVFGLALWGADRWGRSGLSIQGLGWSGALWIGLAQVLALIPGTSRSGVTITAGRVLGLGPVEAARFSFLLSIPVITGAGTYGALQIFQGEAAIDFREFFLALLLSGFTALICIWAFLALLKRVGLAPFIIYRLLLGLVLLYLLF